MATSGQYSFTLNKLQLLTRVLQAINAIDLNDTPDFNDFNFASDMLNMMLKMWEVDGIHLFKRFQATLFPQLNQNSYQIGSVSGADNVCPATNWVNSTISANAPGAVSQVTVASTTGFIVGQYIGVEQDDFSRVWGTITSINTSSNVIIGTFVTTTTCSRTNTVIAYTTKINRPLEVLRATMLDLKSGSTPAERTMGQLSYDEYFNMPIKQTASTPNQFYYDRILNNGIPFTGTMYLYPDPYKSYQIINFTYTDSLQDMLNNNDNLDLPQEWLLPIISNLSVLLAGMGYGKVAEMQTLQQLAAQHYAILKAFDSDSESLMIGQDMTSFNTRFL